MASATRRAIDAAFCDEDQARELHRSVDSFLEAHALTIERDSIGTRVGQTE